MYSKRFTVEDYIFVQMVLNFLKANGLRGETYRAFCLVDRVIQQKINLMSFYEHHEGD